jgi:hypothetical protein
MSLLARLFRRRSKKRPPGPAAEEEIAFAETSRLEPLTDPPEGSGEHIPEFDVGELPTQRLRPILLRDGKPYDPS